MRISTLSFAAAIIIGASFGIAEAGQTQSEHSVLSGWAQNNVREGRSVGVIGQGSLYEMDRPQSYVAGTHSSARGPFEIY
ncbi:MAG: hypothetical protein WDN46_13755 [Methylocella sp.]